MEQHTKKRVAGNFLDVDALDKYATLKIGSSEAMKKVYSEVCAISRKFEKASTDYIHSPYQSFIAAHNIAKGQPRCALQLSSGQGKSVVSILIAHYHELHKRVVLIVVPNKLIKSQLQSDIDKLMKNSSSIDVTTPKYLTLAQKTPEIVIIDEGDLMVQNQTFRFDASDDKASLAGLFVAYFAKKIYFMSATYDRQQKKLLN